MTGVGTSPLFALDPKKTIAQYGQNVRDRKNGLPSNAVNVVLQTKDGYLWLGTSAGLFRFDGVSFTEVSISPETTKTHESISSLCESGDGSLWIGTGYKGLRHIKNGKLSVYGLKEGFYDTQVMKLFETRNGDLLIGTSFGAYNFNEGKFGTIVRKPNYITAIAEDSSGRIWFGTHTGVRILEDPRRAEGKSLTTADGLPNDVTTVIYIDRRSNVWIGTVDGLVRWKNGVVKLYRTTDGLSDNHITSIYEDRDANLWVGTNRGGINRLTGNKWTSFTSTNGLTDNNVLSFEEDHEGSLWICTSDGLNQFKDVSITAYTIQEGLDNNYISSVLESPDGSKYFLSNQGSSITSLKNGIITKYLASVGPAYIAHDGSLWIGQTGILFNLKNGKIVRYDTLNGLPSKWISAITEDNKSLILYSDYTGIFRFVNGQLRPYLMKDGRQYSSREYVVCFYPQPSGALWVGTADSLVRIEDGHSTSFKKADGLAGNWVSSIFDDRKGSLWISSPQGGLTRYRNGTFTAYNTKVGLFTDEIYCVLCDDLMDIWLSSPRGIGYIKRQELDDYADGKINSVHTRVFTTADGMKTDECFGEWQPAGWKARDGRLWFATKKGAVMIDPKDLRRNKLPPPVLIEQVVVDQRSASLDQVTSFPPGAEKLEFHYTALSFLVPERVLFKYKLEGYDRDWVEANTRRAAYYTSLRPGYYRFRVMGCNNDGVWNETGASFAFELQPHFYETYWFFSLVLIALGGSAFGAYRLRVWQLLQREKELSARIQEALANIKVLGGLIPICSNCKKIRDDKGYWDLLEGYIQSHSEAKFSHGICPDCAKKLYPEIFPLKKES
jgi:ligand-binding sensor domain-containing protein